MFALRVQTVETNKGAERQGLFRVRLVALRFLLSAASASQNPIFARIVSDCRMTADAAGRISEHSCTLYDSRRYVIRSHHEHR